jgi:hypothetical protein
MRICGENVEGVLFEQHFKHEVGRKVIQFIDKESGFSNYFLLTDGVPTLEDGDWTLNILALNFLHQCGAYRASMHHVGTATQSAALDQVIKDDK